MAERSDALDLGLLLRCALDPARRPTQDETYARLLSRLRAEERFAHAFDDLLDGLGLWRLSTDDYGVQLGCRSDSPFALRLSQFRPSMKREERMLYGLVLLAAGAYCWPRASELDEWGDGVRRVGVAELTDYLQQLCTRLSEQSKRDPQADHPELREAWREVLRRAASKPSSDGRRSPSTLSGAVAFCLRRLSEAGLLRPDGEEEFRTTRAFRVQLRELAANEAFRLVQKAAQAQGEDA